MNSSPFTRTVAAGLASLAGLVAVPAGAADLVIEVNGIRSVAGRVYIAVHTPREGEKYPYEGGMFAGLQHRAREGAVRFVLRDVPAGRYAVNAFHDENDNGSLDSNLLGIPKEGYAFSNDPATSFGPPSFDEAAVTVGDAPVTAAMSMVY